MKNISKIAAIILVLCASPVLQAQNKDGNIPKPEMVTVTEEEQPAFTLNVTELPLIETGNKVSITKDPELENPPAIKAEVLKLYSDQNEPRTAGKTEQVSISSIPQVKVNDR